MSGNDPARELLDRIADGAAIDWNEPVGIDASLLEAAHTFERVRDAYRRVAAGTACEPVLFHWGPLIVLERTAAGATGEIYRAWDPGLSSMVALKLLRPEAAAAGLTNREFLREAKMLAQIGQRNVLRVYGAAVHDGRPGQWCEWIEGRTLADIVATDGPLPGADAARVASELADALAAIHAAGLTHGDVKAANAMRARDGRIVLTDLGAASDADAALHTQATLVYLSPQARAGSARGPRDDLYALGVLLHYMLTGQYPDHGASRVHDFAPKAPRALRRVVERALDCDPARRFDSAAQFSRSVRAGTRDAALPFTRRTGLALAGTAVLALLGLAAWQAWRPVPWAPHAALVRHGHADAPLHDGDALHVGDRLDLSLASDRPTWVWVLNEDESGTFHVLFPLAGLRRANPLPRGENVLPGGQDGRALSWQVSSAGGREEFLIVLADTPLPDFERRIASFTAASIDNLERGVARVSAAPPGGVALHGPHLHALLAEFARTLGNQRHVRKLGLRFDAATTP